MIKVVCEKVVKYQTDLLEFELLLVFWHYLIVNAAHTVASICGLHFTEYLFLQSNQSMFVINLPKYE